MREKEHRPSSSAPRSVCSLGDVRGEEGGGKAGSRIASKRILNYYHHGEKLWLIASGIENTT